MVPRYLLVITTIASSYIFTITFIQLGLPNFGTVTLGLEQGLVNKAIMLFGITGGLCAYVGGVLLDKVRNNIHLIILIRSVAVVITLIGRSLSPLVVSGSGYLVWTVFMGVILGLGSSFNYVLVYLLLPPKNRGLMCDSDLLSH